MTPAFYYFRAHLYTCVPRHIREDLQWMADHGADAVAVAVLEQDLYHAVENLECIAEEAARVGLQFHAVPSRWGGHVAGSPKVPSGFTSAHPESWAIDPAGRPYLSETFGAMTSIYHPQARELWEQKLERLFSLIPVAAVIVDEPKAFKKQDFSPAAREALGERCFDPAAHEKPIADFYDWICARAKQLQPSCETVLFTYGNAPDSERELLAALPNLDVFGCDGRPWGTQDGGSDDSRDASAPAAAKCLVDHGPVFIEAARRHGKKSMFLIENHALTNADITLMEKYLPEVLSMRPDHLYAYYYPRSVQSPDRAMAIIGRALQSI